VREERPASTGEIESLPAVVQGTGTLFMVLLGYIFLVFPFIFGHLVANVVWTALGGCAGSLPEVGYFLWKPLNLFWDNVYTPNPFAALTPGELRAVAFLNSGRGRLAVLDVADPGRRRGRSDRAAPDRGRGGRRASDRSRRHHGGRSSDLPGVSEAPRSFTVLTRFQVRPE
jgi:hypothetical protein